MAAVVKGTPATTLVLWRCLKNRLTHARVAPDRGDYAADWASVDEDRIRLSRAPWPRRTRVAEQLPPGRDCWNFRFNELYSLNIVNARQWSNLHRLSSIRYSHVSPPSLDVSHDARDEAARVHGASVLETLEHAPHGDRRLRARRRRRRALVPSQRTSEMWMPPWGRAARPPTRTASMPRASAASVPGDGPSIVVVARRRGRRGSDGDAGMGGGGGGGGCAAGEDSLSGCRVGRLHAVWRVVGQPARRLAVVLF